MVEEELRRQKEPSEPPSPPPEDEVFEEEGEIGDVKKSPSNYSALSYELYVEQTKGEVEDDNKEQMSLRSDLEEEALEGGGGSNRSSTILRRKVSRCCSTLSDFPNVQCSICLS